MNLPRPTQPDQPAQPDQATKPDPAGSGQRPRTPGRLLIVTAVEAEAEAVRAGIRSAGVDPAAVVVSPVGVGPAAAAAATARLLTLAEAAHDPYRAVISAGIAGGFPGRASVGATVLGARTIAADLGAESPDGFLPVDQLGFGSNVIEADPTLLKSLITALPAAVVGDVLTLATVTGTAQTAGLLQARHPHAVAEAMEGYGVACAAGLAGVPFAELRAVSNPVGPRDRAAWRLREAFSALAEAAAAACG
ncbi:futalosine hydrolase [Actinoplanes sp. NPDC049599]|uniref:futalosine hydrolase n=1 Tax=Actinoplanes sp. NPDC049599 TaxID=3363903 RepID=UPI0037A27E23